MKDSRKRSPFSQLREEIQKNHPRAVRPPDPQEGLKTWSDALNALIREDEPPPVSSQQAEPAQRATREEIDFAIESAAQELRKNPKLTREGLYERLFGPEDKRAPSLKKKNWAKDWTLSRLIKKVWKRARERAELDPIAPKGRPPEK